jgi:hypothetical protein
LRGASCAAIVAHNNTRAASIFTVGNVTGAAAQRQTAQRRETLREFTRPTHVRKLPMWTTAVLLLLVMAGSASACAIGQPDGGDGCRRATPQSCARASVRGCPNVLKERPANCGLRGLFRTYPGAARRFSGCTGLRLVCGRAPAAEQPDILNTSIGSPETDRGPPRS